MNVSTAAVLASQVFDQNRGMVRWKRKTKAIGYPALFRQQLTMRNATEVPDMDVDNNPAPFRQRLTVRNATEVVDMDVDDNDPAPLNFSESVMMGEDFDEAYSRSGQMVPHVEHSKSLQNISDISLVDQEFYVDHAGPSGHTHDDFLLPDPLYDYRAPSLPDDDAVMGENLDDEVYGQSNLRRSQWIVSHVEHSNSFRNISHQPS